MFCFLCYFLPPAEPKPLTKPIGKEARKSGPGSASKRSPVQLLSLPGLIRNRLPPATTQDSTGQLPKPTKMIPDPDISIRSMNGMVGNSRTNADNRLYVLKSEIKAIVQLKPRKKELKCKACGEISNTTADHISHGQGHVATGDGGYKYQCRECGDLFRHSSSLVVHRRKHTGEK
eukprot:scpid97692/ scgid3294/ Zinc finger protein 734